MQGNATATLPRRLLDRLWPLHGHLNAFMPALPGLRGIHAAGVDTGGATLGRLGTLEVRLAQSAAEIREAQRLRYRVFYEEGAAVANAKVRFLRRDTDAFDAICDHLLVIDHAHDSGASPAVGTYRLLRQSVAQQHRGFYTAAEFDIARLLAQHPSLNFLELGRSCVLAPYRNKRTVELLWHGCWSYVLRNRLDVMVGCASLDGTDPDALALQLSFLHHFARAPEDWRTQAVPHRYVEMNRMPKEAIDPRAALRLLPPLIKGYLRLGASIGDGAVIDTQFGTTDVLIILPVSALNPRYVEHFGADAARHAA
jgi:L-ornithine Nalpha-acyltransferase